MIAYPLTDILFMDIETVPLIYRFDQLSSRTKRLFEKKVAYKIDENTTVEDLYDRKAGIWAEFGKVVTVAMGKFALKKEEGREFVLKVYASRDEKKLLQKVSAILENFYKPEKKRWLCAHNGKEFDFPYLARRMIINGLPLPHLLNVHAKRPWETPFCDTLELWQFGDRKHYTSLDLLCEILGIPTSKHEIDGSDIARLYYEENRLEDIARYCGEDVIALTNVLLRLKGEPLLEPAEINDSLEILDG